LRRTNKLARELKQAALEVREVDNVLGLAPDFPEEMIDFSQYLEGLYAEEIRSTVLSRGSGLQAELVDAVKFVRMATGKPHYPEIADIVQILSGKLRSEDDLRKVVCNFEDKSFFDTSRSERELQQMVLRSQAKCSIFASKNRP
jgi:hypothetical protein